MYNTSKKKEIQLYITIIPGYTNNSFLIAVVLVLKSPCITGTFYFKTNFYTKVATLINTNTTDNSKGSKP